MRSLNLKKEISLELNKKNKGIHPYAAKMVTIFPHIFYQKKKKI